MGSGTDREPKQVQFQGNGEREYDSKLPYHFEQLTNAHTIFRPDLASIRGKTVRQTPAPVVGDYVKVLQLLVQTTK